MSVGCPTAASTAHPLFVVALVEEHVSLFLLLKANRCLFLPFFQPAKSQWRAEMIWVRVKAVCVALQTEAKDHRRDDSQVLTVCLAHAPRFFQQRHSNMNIGSCYPFIFLTLSCSDNREDFRLDVSSHMPSVSSPSPLPVLTAHTIQSSFSCRLVRYLRAWKYSSVDPRLLSAVIKSRNAAQFKLIKPFIKLNNLCFTWEEGNCTFSRAIL